MSLQTDMLTQDGRTNVGKPGEGIVLSDSYLKTLLATLIACLALVGCGGGGGGDDDGDGPPPDVLSGSIQIEARTRIDSDTADDIFVGTAVSNDDSPQSFPSPVLAAGYLSANGGTYDNATTQSPATSFYQDLDDSFRLTLDESQVVTIQAFRVAGATFYGTPEVRVLLDNSEQGVLTPSSPVTFSTSVDSRVYDLELLANSGGPLRYVISVTSASNATALQLRYPEPDWVAGEALITLASPVRAQALASTTLGSAIMAPLGLNTWRVTRPASALAATTTGQKRETLSWIETLREEPGVISAEPNYLYEALAVNPTNDPLYPQQQWHYQAINLPTAWQAISNPGAAVRVAVLDTGVFSSTPAAGGNWHPDLIDNLQILTPSDYVTGDLDVDGQSGVDANPANPGGDTTTPTNFHGTHVAGTIAAVDNTIGGIGIAPLATLQPVRVLGKNGVGSSADLINAINALNGLPDSARPAIINLSLGGLGPSSALQQAIDQAAENGTLVIAAAGNDGSSEVVYPAGFDNVLAVGAVDAGNQRASYSNFGSWIDLVAPGGDASRDGNNDGQADVVFSAWGTQTGSAFEPAYAGLQGTSMAAPHVSGVAALLKQIQPGLTVAQFREYLRRGEFTDVIGNQNEYGYGLINAVKAVDAASGGKLGTFLTASPSAFQFDGSVTQSSVTLSAVPASASDQVLQTVSFEENPESWLRIERSGDSDTVILNATITNTEAAEQTSVTVNYTADGTPKTLTLPVNVQLGDPTSARNAGRHYVLLISQDEEDGITVQDVVEASSGNYSFSFEDVPEGEYLLVGGSDLDNNGVICEPGEACAEYPTNGLPQVIVKGDSALTGLTMTTSFRRPTLSAESLPRVGFEGYRIRGVTESSATKDSSATKRVPQ